MAGVNHGNSFGEMSGGGVWNKTANFLFGTNMRDGEKHMLQYTPDGFKSGSYIGPGTDLRNRIREGIEPVSETDKTAQAHDLRYAFSNSNDDVRAADMKMRSKLKDIEKAGTDYRFNTWQGRFGIWSKNKMEDWGIAKPENFTTYGNHDKYSPEDRKMLRDKLTELEQQGYGQHGGSLFGKLNSAVNGLSTAHKLLVKDVERTKTDPIHRAKRNLQVAVAEGIYKELKGHGKPASKRGGNGAWIAHVKKYQATHKCSYKQAMKDARASYKRK